MNDRQQLETNAAGIDRREFTLRSLLVMLSGVAITISGCSGNDGRSPTTPNPPSATDKTGAVSDNHGHAAVITGAQLTAGGDLTLDIRGMADHPHTVRLAAAEVVSIRNGQRVAKDTSTDASHSHTVTFN